MLSILTNGASLSTQRNMGVAQKKLDTTMLRLSTGLRINRASDDVAGSVTASQLTSNIRGITAALKQVGIATSMINTADSSLTEMKGLVQSMRELAVEGSSTKSDTERTNLVNALTQYMDQYQDLASGIEFNGIKLFDGTFTNKSFQVGSGSNDQLSLTISDMRTSSIGEVAIFTSKTVVTSTAGTTASALTDTGGFSIGSTSFTSADFSDDGVSNVEGDESAIAWANAINEESASTGVRARVNTNSFTLTYNSADDLAATASLTINGTQVTTGVAYSASDTGAQSLVDDINDNSTTTGVTATLDTTNNTIVLSASDGRNIDIAYVHGTAAASATNVFGFGSQIAVTTTTTTGSSFTSLVRGTITLYSNDTFSLTNAEAAGELTASASQSVSTSSTTSLNNISLASSDASQDALFYLDNALNQIDEAYATVGSTGARLASVSAELSTRKESFQNALSTVQDADITEETANLSLQQILVQAGGSVLSRAQQISQVALSLLQG